MSTLKDTKEAPHGKDQHTEALPGDDDGLVEMGRVSETKGGILGSIQDAGAGRQWA